MNLLFDFLPIVIFFIIYKFYGIYTATFVAIIISLLQIAIFWFKNRRVEITHLITCAILLTLGTATLLSKNPIFIKWKPTAVFWLLAIAFFVSNYIGKKPLIRRLLNDKITLPEKVWQVLNLSWIIFFIVVGTINIFIAYNFSTDIWVDFKLFGILGATLIFGIAQSFYVAKFAMVNVNDQNDKI